MGKPSALRQHPHVVGSHDGRDSDERGERAKSQSHPPATRAMRFTCTFDDDDLGFTLDATYWNPRGKEEGKHRGSHLARIGSGSKPLLTSLLRRVRQARREDAHVPAALARGRAPGTLRRISTHTSSSSNHVALFVVASRILSAVRTSLVITIFVGVYALMIPAQRLM